MARKEPKILDTTKDPLTGRFGLFDKPENLKKEYSAFVGWRTIWDKNRLDFVWNRNSCYGTEKEVDTILGYFSKKKLQKKVHEWAMNVGSGSDKILEFGEYFDGTRIEGKASPRGSYGYIYIQIGMKGNK